jgi:16S rRNA processing protein RimM
LSSSELVTVGRVGRPHGVDGSFFVENASEAEERFSPGATLYADGTATEIVASKRGAGGRRVIKLDRPVARGAALGVPRSSLPEPEADSYYVFQLVGLEVVEDDGGRLGVVADVENAPANDVLVLDNGLLLPLVDACVLEIDVAGGTIRVAPGFADDE